MRDLPQQPLQSEPSGRDAEPGSPAAGAAAPRVHEHIHEHVHTYQYGTGTGQHVAQANGAEREHAHEEQDASLLHEQQAHMEVGGDREAGDDRAATSSWAPTGTFLTGFGSDSGSDESPARRGTTYAKHEGGKARGPANAGGPAAPPAQRASLDMYNAYDTDDDDDDDDDDDGDIADDADEADETSRSESSRASIEGAWSAGEVLALDLTPPQVQLVRSLGFGVVWSRRLDAVDSTVFRLSLPSGVSELDALALLRRETPGELYTLNHEYRLAADPCRDGRCVGHRMIAWPDPVAGGCDREVRIGLVDTAVNSIWAGLAADAIRAERFADQPQRSNPAHGSAVAALLAGQPNAGVPGLLPKARLYAADVFDSDASGNSKASAAYVAEGIDWLIRQGVAVINISLAGPPNLLLERAVAAAAQAGVAVVASAGNDGPDALPVFPAAYPDVISVTAVDARRRLYSRANRGNYITVAAPGVGIWTPTAGGGEYRQGTSFAAPFVTAWVALKRADGISVAALESHLRASVVDLGAPGRDPLFGWGLLSDENGCR